MKKIQSALKGRSAPPDYVLSMYASQFDCMGRLADRFHCVEFGRDIYQVLICLQLMALPRLSSKEFIVVPEVDNMKILVGDQVV